MIISTYNGGQPICYNDSQGCKSSAVTGLQKYGCMRIVSLGKETHDACSLCTLQLMKKSGARSLLGTFIANCGTCTQYIASDQKYAITMEMKVNNCVPALCIVSSRLLQWKSFRAETVSNDGSLCQVDVVRDFADFDDSFKHSESHSFRSVCDALWPFGKNSALQRYNCGKNSAF